MKSRLMASEVAAVVVVVVVVVLMVVVAVVGGGDPPRRHASSSSARYAPSGRWWQAGKPAYGEYVRRGVRMHASGCENYICTAR